jgi:LEA14-like dessication related protein
MNIYAKIGLALIAFIGGSKLLSAQRALAVGNDLNVNIINPRLGKISFTDMEVIVDVQLQNPTQGKLHITQPFVQLFSNETRLSSTLVSNKSFTLKPLSQTTLDPFIFKLEFTAILDQLEKLNYNIPQNYNFIKKAAWLVSNKNYLLNQMKLMVKYTTQVNGLQYSNTEHLNF